MENCASCRQFQPTAEPLGLCNNVKYTVIDKDGNMTSRNVICYSTDRCNWHEKIVDKTANIADLVDKIE